MNSTCCNAFHLGRTFHEAHTTRRSHCRGRGFQMNGPGHVRPQALKADDVKCFPKETQTHFIKCLERPHSRPDPAGSASRAKRHWMVAHVTTSNNLPECRRRNEACLLACLLACLPACRLACLLAFSRRKMKEKGRKREEGGIPSREAQCTPYAADQGKSRQREQEERSQKK